jgi:hypothetical protein
LCIQDSACTVDRLRNPHLIFHPQNLSPSVSTSVIVSAPSADVQVISCPILCPSKYLHSLGHAVMPETFSTLSHTLPDSDRPMHWSGLTKTAPRPGPDHDLGLWAVRAPQYPKAGPDRLVWSSVFVKSPKTGPDRTTGSLATATARDRPTTGHQPPSSPELVMLF